jgi:DNA-binding NarL/FixJ family response regulator
VTPPPPPAELAALSRLLAPAELLALVEHCGGTRIYVPTRPSRGSPVTRAVGAAAAARLAEGYGGQQLKVPLARAWLVRTYAAQGQSQSQIARRLRITESAVWRLLRDARDARQSDLFA